MHSTEDGGRRDLPAARYISSRNAEAVVGQSWRWCRDHAKAWGVEILRVDGKSFIEAARFCAALAEHAVVHAAEVDDLESFRRRVARAG